MENSLLNIQNKDLLIFDICKEIDKVITDTKEDYIYLRLSFVSKEGWTLLSFEDDDLDMNTKELWSSTFVDLDSNYSIEQIANELLDNVLEYIEYKKNS